MSRPVKSKKQTAPVVVAEPVPVVEPVVDDEDEENERLFALIKANKAKKALREATADIQRYRDRAKAEIQTLIDRDEKLILEIQERITAHKAEQTSIDGGFKDAVLTASIVRQAEQIQVSTITPPPRPPRAEGAKRVREVVPRPKLWDIIKSRLNFRWEGHTCYTDNGRDFIEPDGNVLRSLNTWTETLIERAGGGGRKVSVYVVVDVQNNETGEWKNWGKVYTKDCIELEF